MDAPLLKALALALLLHAGGPAIAGEEMLDLDTRFRAKLAKEKLKQGQRERAAAAATGGIDKSSCGSQNIGNIETGRVGTAPREVFVFAPNAINLVTAGGCR